MDQQVQQLIERLKEANNILLTVPANPTVDQLAAVIGLTLLLNKQAKHATAVFSGQIPSTIEFLKPEKTIEKNTDSLRDFIISLDKSKADKLRYKVEDKLVKIYITPYRTSISDKDLEFSHGDFNVEVVLALGVNNKVDLDKAITANGRILHDATVVTVSTQATSGLGSIHWVDNKASSLCEMVVNLSTQLGIQDMDSQAATALLTGIVAETQRFSNEKTSPNTMAISSKLMSAGANQQLVATKLQEKPKVELQPQAPLPSTNVVNTNTNIAPPAPLPPQAPPSDGSLKINHNDEPPIDLPEPGPQEDDEEDVEKIHIDDNGILHSENDRKLMTEDRSPLAGHLDPNTSPPLAGQNQNGPAVTPVKEDVNKMVMEPPVLGSKLTANTEPEQLDPSTDPLSNTSTDNKHKLLRHDPVPASAATDPKAHTGREESVDEPVAQPSSLDGQTQLSTGSEDSTQQNSQPEEVSSLATNIDSARGAVEAAVNTSVNAIADNIQPVVALNAQSSETQSDSGDSGNDEHAQKPDVSVDSDPGLPPGILPTPPTEQSNQSSPPTLPPPPVPPPMMPPAMPPTQQPASDKKAGSNDQQLAL